MTLPFIGGYVLGARQAGRAAGLSASAAAFNASATEQFIELNDRIDRLVAVVEVLWSMVQESGFTAEELQERLAALDAADGVEDGRVVKPAGECRNCGAAVSAGYDACQFCGEPTGAGDPFAKL